MPISEDGYAPFTIVTSDWRGINFQDEDRAGILSVFLSAAQPFREGKPNPFFEKWIPILFGEPCTEDFLWRSGPELRMLSVIRRLWWQLRVHCPHTVIYNDMVQVLPMEHHVHLVPILATALEHNTHVVLCTYSYLHIQALQVEMSEGRINPEDDAVRIHLKGETLVLRPNEYGNFEEWPLDFMTQDVDLAYRHLKACSTRGEK